jgi:hypothetical protein
VALVETLSCEAAREDGSVPISSMVGWGKQGSETDGCALGKVETPGPFGLNVGASGSSWVVGVVADVVRAALPKSEGVSLTWDKLHGVLVDHIV